MRHRLFVVLLSGSLATLPLAQAIAAAAPGTKPATASKATKNPATHATTGVVKSISTSALVLTPTGRQGKEMTFAIATSAHRDAGIAVGSDVSVRYHTEGGVNTVTAITARHHSATK